jgi:hypothetical protein
MSKNPTPSRAKLIALLIEERARNIDKQRALGHVIVLPEIASRDRARAEIEAEVLTQTTRSRQ